MEWLVLVVVVVVYGGGTVWGGKLPKVVISFENSL
jgi:hypothetical protein